MSTFSRTLGGRSRRRGRLILGQALRRGLGREPLFQSNDRSEAAIMGRLQPQQGLGMFRMVIGQRPRPEESARDLDAGPGNRRLFRGEAKAGEA